MSENVEGAVLAPPTTHRPRRTLRFERRSAATGVTPFTIAGQPLGWPVYAAAMLLAFAVMVARRPTGFFHPTLWAEDGPIFLKSAYLDPWYRSLWHPYNGYMHVGLRMWAELTSLLPPSAVAASCSVFALASFPLCLSVVLSRRLRWLIPSDGARAVLFAALVLLPGTRETIGNLTNALWPIGIGLVLLSFCDAPRTRAGRIAELVALGLGGLTGATSMLVWPAFALRWWRQRTRHNAQAFVVILSTAVVQGIILLANPRSQYGLKPDIKSLVKAVTLRVWGLLGLGEHTLTWHVFNKPTSIVVLAVCACGIALTIAALVALPWLARLQLASVFALSLGATAWSFDFNLDGATNSNAHGRYFLIPAVMVLLAVFAAASTPAWHRRVVRLGALAPAALLFAFAVFVDLGLPAMPQTYWASTASCIDHHQTCTVVMNPPNFTFDLPPIK